MGRVQKTILLSRLLHTTTGSEHAESIGRRGIEGNLTNRKKTLALYECDEFKKPSTKICKIYTISIISADNSCTKNVNGLNVYGDKI